MSIFRLNPQLCESSLRKALKDVQFRMITDYDLDIICKYLVAFHKKENEVKEMVVNIIHAGKNDKIADFANLMLKINILEKYGQVQNSTEVIEIN